MQMDMLTNTDSNVKVFLGFLVEVDSKSCFVLIKHM